jgi:ribonuclease HI
MTRKPDYRVGALAEDPAGPVPAGLGAGAAWTWRWPMPSASTRCSWACPSSDALRANRMPHRWVACDSLWCPPLPVHRRRPTLSPRMPPEARWRCTASSTRCLSQRQPRSGRAAARAGTRARPAPDAARGRARAGARGPCGHLGFNPASLWGLRQRRSQWPARWAWARAATASCRVRRVHRLLAAARLAAPAGLRGRAGRFGCWRPPLATERWLQRTAWMERWANAGGRCSARPTSWWRSSACAACAWSAWPHAARERRKGRDRPPARGGAAAARRTGDHGEVMTEVVIYTDGACKGNPGPGGWGAWLRSGAHEKELWGGEALTTNNRMELTAVIEALASLKRRCRVTIYTDSEYVRNGITTWIHGWKAAGLEDGRPQAGEEHRAVAAPGRAARAHQVEWRWVKGHAGDPGNERADAAGQPRRRQARGHEGLPRKTRIADDRADTVPDCTERPTLEEDLIPLVAVLALGWPPWCRLVVAATACDRRGWAPVAAWRDRCAAVQGRQWWRAGRWAGGGPAAVEVGKVQAHAHRRRRPGRRLAALAPGRDAAPRGQRPHRKLGFADGQRVRRGQLLVQLDDTLQRPSCSRPRRRPASRAPTCSAAANCRPRASSARARSTRVPPRWRWPRPRWRWPGPAGPHEGAGAVRRHGRHPPVNVGDYVKDGADIVNLVDLSSPGWVDFRCPSATRPRCARAGRSRWPSTPCPGAASRAVSRRWIRRSTPTAARCWCARGGQPGPAAPGHVCARHAWSSRARECAGGARRGAGAPGHKQLLFKVVEGAGGQKVAQRLEAKVGLRLPGKVELLEGVKPAIWWSPPGRPPDARRTRAGAPIDLSPAGRRPRVVRPAGASALRQLLRFRPDGAAPAGAG